MSKLFFNILSSFFLLLHSTAMAEEEISAEESSVEVQESESPEEEGYTEEENEPESQTEVTQEPEEVEPKEVLSEAQKEALAAEAAELREVGMEEEPIPE